MYERTKPKFYFWRFGCCSQNIHNFFKLSPFAYLARLCFSTRFGYPLITISSYCAYFPVLKTLTFGYTFQRMSSAHFAHLTCFPPKLHLFSLLFSGSGVCVCSFPFRGLSFLFHPCTLHIVQFRPVCIFTPCFPIGFSSAGKVRCIRPAFRPSGSYIIPQVAT